MWLPGGPVYNAMLQQARVHQSAPDTLPGQYYQHASQGPGSNMMLAVPRISPSYSHGASRTQTTASGQRVHSMSAAMPLQPGMLQSGGQNIHAPTLQQLGPSYSYPAPGPWHGSNQMQSATLSPHLAAGMSSAAPQEHTSSALPCSAIWRQMPAHGGALGPVPPQSHLQSPVAQPAPRENQPCQELQTHQDIPASPMWNTAVPQKSEKVDETRGSTALEPGSSIPDSMEDIVHVLSDSDVMGAPHHCQDGVTCSSGVHPLCGSYPLPYFSDDEESELSPEALDASDLVEGEDREQQQSWMHSSCGCDQYVTEETPTKCSPTTSVVTPAGPDEPGKVDRGPRPALRKANTINGACRQLNADSTFAPEAKSVSVSAANSDPLKRARPGVVVAWLNAQPVQASPTAPKTLRRWRSSASRLPQALDNIGEECSSEEPNPFPQDAEAAEGRAMNMFLQEQRRRLLQIQEVRPSFRRHTETNPRYLDASEKGMRSILPA